MTNVAVTTQQAAVTVTTASNVTVVPTTQTAAVVVQGAVQAPAASGIILESKQVISEDYTLTAGSNGISQGPVAIEVGYTVTIPAGAIWGIL